MSCNCPGGFAPMHSAGNVSTGNPSQFHFKVLGPRACDGGSQMLTEQQNQYCSQFTQAQIDCANCSKGFKGTSVCFEYTPVSNGNWENAMCQELGSIPNCAEGSIWLN